MFYYIEEEMQALLIFYFFNKHSTGSPVLRNANTQAFDPISSCSCFYKEHKLNNDHLPLVVRVRVSTSIMRHCLQFLFYLHLFGVIMCLHHLHKVLCLQGVSTLPFSIFGALAFLSLHLFICVSNKVIFCL